MLQYRLSARGQTINFYMETGTVISPVNIESRKEIGIRPGDTVRVWQKIEEKGKTRLQAFEGLVLARKHGSEPGATFTVRRVASGVGVEKVFPLYSPMIDKIEIVRRANVRRAKLYYIREKAAREIRRHMRNMMMMERATESDMAAKAQEASEKAAQEEVSAAEQTETEEKENMKGETVQEEESSPTQETEKKESAPSDKGEEAPKKEEKEEK